MLGTTLSISAIIVALLNTAYFLGVIAQKIKQNSQRATENAIMIKENKKYTDGSIEKIGERVGALETSTAVSHQKYTDLCKRVDDGFNRMDKSFIRIETLIEKSSV